MRLTTPRVAPTEATDWDEQQKELMDRFEKGVGSINVMRTLIRHADLVRRWLPFTNHILYKSTLPVREREFVILRVAWKAQAEYEWGQHVIIAREEGLTDEEIERVAAGPDVAGWSELEAALLRAVDELEADNIILDDTWKTLTQHYNEHQIADLIFTVGNYRMLAGAINSFGVQLDEGVPGFPR